MEPHFLYNALTSIQGFMAQGDVHASARYLAKFAKLMRGLLNAAHHERSTLAEEMALLENYCALEALRSDPAFTFSITIDPDLPHNAHIPSFMVQPHVENAIRHGLRPLTDGRTGELQVHFARAGADTVRCSVRDNGIGRVASAASPATDHARSMGTGITAERARLMARSFGADRISVRTEDLYTQEGQACGTSVTLLLPLTNTPGTERP
jgi:LytS/YehU family sensor histidine kinase